MNTTFRKPLPGTALDYFDTRAAVDAIQAGAYDKLPYTSRVLAENLVRRCDPDSLTDALRQIIERKRELDFPWFPARVVCHDILGQTAWSTLPDCVMPLRKEGETRRRSTR
jgi:aconitase A